MINLEKYKQKIDEFFNDEENIKRWKKQEEIVDKQVSSVLNFIENYPDEDWDKLVKEFCEKQEKLSEYWYTVKHVAKISRLMDIVIDVFEIAGDEVEYDEDFGDFWSGGVTYRGYTICRYFGQGTIYEVFNNKTKEYLYVSK